MYGTRKLSFSAAGFVAPGGINNRRPAVIISSLVSFLLGSKLSVLFWFVHTQKPVRLLFFFFFFPAVTVWFSLVIVSVVTFPVSTGVCAAVWAGCALWQS